MGMAVIDGDCDECGGEGVLYAPVSVDLFGKPFAYRYIKKIQAFPNICGKLVPSPNGGPDMLFFSFDGGEGALMPRDRPAPRHFSPIPLS